MSINPRRVAYQIAIPFLWGGVFIGWAVLSVLLLVILAPAFFDYFFGFDTDPDPPGGEESDPYEGRFVLK